MATYARWAMKDGSSWQRWSLSNTRTGGMPTGSISSGPKRLSDEAAKPGIAMMH